MIKSRPPVSAGAAADAAPRTPAAAPHADESDVALAEAGAATREAAEAATRATRAAAATVYVDDENQAWPSPTALPGPSSPPLADRGAQWRSGAQARAASLMMPSRDRVEWFIQDGEVDAAGRALTDLTRSGVDLFADGADFVLSAVGGAADAIADATMGSGAKLDAVADEVRGKMQTSIDDLRERAATLGARAHVLLSGVEAFNDDRRIEAQQMWAAGELIGAVAARLETLIHRDEAKALLAQGGTALFKVTSDLVDVVAELTHKGAKAAAVGITMAGRFLKWLAGKDTLRSTAITVFGGLRVNLVSEALNAGVGGGLYFPSFKERDAKSAAVKAAAAAAAAAAGAAPAEQAGDAKRTTDRKTSYFDVIAFDWGASACSPVAGGGWNSRGGGGMGVNLYFVSATFNSMTERVFIGVPGVWGVMLGRDVERGSEINFGNNVGLAGGPDLGVYATYGVSLHSPLLDPVNKYVTRPIAKVIVQVSRKVADAATWSWQKLRG